MLDMPANAAVVVWTPAGPKIMNTDACGEMVDFARARAERLAAARGGARILPPLPMPKTKK